MWRGPQAAAFRVPKGEGSSLGSEKYLRNDSKDLGSEWIRKIWEKIGKVLQNAPSNNFLEAAAMFVTRRGFATMTIMRNQMV